MDKFDNDFNNYEGQPNHEINSRYGRHHGRPPHERHERHELHHSRYDDNEFAADFVADSPRGGDATSGAVIAGIVGVVAGFIALFIYPLALGLVGVALGCYAIAKGNKVLGYTAIGIGLLAAVMPLFSTGPFISLF